MTRSRAIRWARWGVAAAGVLLVLAVGVRLSLLDGWLRTVRIDGASMAPTLCGTHLAVTCTDCGISFRCDGENLPENGRLVCPNCGFRELKATQFPLRPGDTVLVDRWPVLRDNLKRWDVVAISDPITGSYSVKRIAGLPGETLSIHGGDLYAEGRIVRKSLVEFRETATLVHDNDHLPRSFVDKGDFLRWKPQNERSLWQTEAGRFPWEPAAAGGDLPPDWLHYVHWRCDGSLTPRAEPASILDNDPYNQAQARRLNEVSDLLLSCQVQFPLRGELALGLFARGRWLEARLDAAASSIAMTQDGRQLASRLYPRRLAGRTLRIEFGQFDARLLLAVENHEVLWQSLDEDAARTPDQPPVTSPLKIACTGGRFEISRLCVWRDLYLLEPNGTDRDWTMKGPLNDDEFLLLGDNPPVSIDSRHWHTAGLARRTMRGVVTSRPRQAP